MASMAVGGAARIVRGIDPVTLVPRSRTQIASAVSTYRSVGSARYCRTIISRNAEPIKIRAMCSSSVSEDAVKKTIRENPVVVYSKSWCPYSSEVKYLFKSVGVEPLVIELDQLGSQGSELQRTLEKLTGQYTVPNVFIGGNHVGGCTDTANLHEEGKLEPLLSKAGATKPESSS